MVTPVYVTQPSLVPLGDLQPYLEQIWRSRVLTNGGPLHERLERRLAEHLGVEHLSLFNNGTIALMAAVKALDLRGEVITTPFSFVATAHSLAWNGLTPIFADIEPDGFNLDPRCVEDAITPATTGILPVHCYGYPCDVEAFRQIGEQNGLKVLYDAAHAFDVRIGRSSILDHGDMSILSFHATKVFTTVEGGAVVCRDAATKRRIDLLRNFGFVGETRVDEVGVNGKMSELHAAFGLVHLEHAKQMIADRARVDGRYRSQLAKVEGITIPSPPGNATQNGSYFPILVGPNYPLTRDGLYDLLKAHGILSRRYFFPLISDLGPYINSPGNRSPMPVANRVAAQVLCLPIFPHLTEADQDRVIDLVAHGK